MDWKLLFSAPGGMLVGDESISAAAARETREETGYKVTTREKVLELPSPDGAVVFHLFWCVLGSDLAARTDQEAVGTVWADPASIPIQAYRFPTNRDRFIEAFGLVAAQDYRTTQDCAGTTSAESGSDTSGSVPAPEYREHAPRPAP